MQHKSIFIITIIFLFSLTSMLSAEEVQPDSTPAINNIFNLELTFDISKNSEYSDFGMGLEPYFNIVKAKWGILSVPIKTGIYMDFNPIFTNNFVIPLLSGILYSFPVTNKILLSAEFLAGVNFEWNVGFNRGFHFSGFEFMTKAGIKYLLTKNTAFNLKLGYGGRIVPGATNVEYIDGFRLDFGLTFLFGNK